MFKYLTIKALKLSRVYKRILAMSLDIIICISSTWIALSFRLNQLIAVNLEYTWAALLSVIVAIPIFLMFGFYQVIHRYINNDIVKVLIKAIALYTIIYSMILTVFGIQGVPRSIGLMQPMVMFLLIVASRLLVKNWLDDHFLDKSIEIEKKK